MKFLMTVFLMTLSLSSFAQGGGNRGDRGERGGVTSGGMPGFQYLNCQGEIYVTNTKLAEVAINVEVTRMGMMATIMKLDSGKRYIAERTERKTDHFGITYVSKNLTIEIPQIPSPTWGQGEVTTVIKMKNIRPSTIMCNAFSPN